MKRERIIYGVKVRLKSESHIMRFMNFFIKLWNKEFMEHYWTTMNETVYAPSSYDQHFDNASYDVNIKSIIHHETIHILDYKKYGILFGLTYFFPPVIFAYGRWYWERRAYLPELIDLYKLPSNKFDIRLEQIVEALSGPHYFYAWPKKKVREWFVNEVRRSI